MRKLPLDELQVVLFDSILGKDSIQQMFDKIYALLKLPLNYFDTSFRLIANALPRPFYFEPWIEMDEQRFAAGTSIQRGNYFSYQERMYVEKKSSIFDYGPCEGYPQACGPVFQGQSLIGYMGTMIEDAIWEDVITANDLIIDAISVIQRRDISPDIQFLENFDNQALLLRGVLPDRDFEVFEIYYPPPYIYLVMTSEANPVTKIHYVYASLQQQNCSAISCMSGENYLNLLLYGFSPKNGIPCEITKLSEKHNLPIGVSDTFCNIRSIIEYRNQALLALSLSEIAPNTPCIRYYEELCFELFALDVYEKCKNLSFLQPELRKLIENDIEKNSDNVSFLKAYLDCLRKASALAKTFDIHKNSVFRRLRRIEEITELNLYEPGIVSQLDIQLEILRVVYKYHCQKGGGQIWKLN